MTIADLDVLKSCHGFCSHLNARLITFQLHIRNNDIITSHFAGSSLKTKSIVATDNITITNTYMLATININTIIMSYSKTAYRHIVDIHITTLEIMGSPGTCIF